MVDSQKVNSKKIIIKIMNDNENDQRGRQLMNTDCPIHGDVGMVYKCMFCCNPSLYLVNSNTYYCDQCHQNINQIAGEKSFPPCNGNCHFAPHPPNGERTLIGYCALCEQENQ